MITISSENRADQNTLMKFRSRNKVAFWVGLVIVVLSLISGFGTYFILTGLTPLNPNPTVTTIVMLLNVILVIAMFVLIGWHVYKLWLAQHNQAAAANLHVRIVALFSVIAALPAILLAVFATISLDRGLDHWFSSRTKSIIHNSLGVAEAYMEEHGDVIRADITGMAQDVDRAAGLVKADPKRFRNFLKTQAALRALPMAFLLDEDGKVLSIAANKLKSQYQPPPKRAMQIAKEGQIVVITPSNTNNVRALKKLVNFRDTFLYVMRPVNPSVTKHLKQTRARVAEYRRLQSGRKNVQVGFAMMQLAIALTLLLSAIWIGLWFANRIVNPIRRLIYAAQNVSQGNLDVQVKVKQKEGDLAKLSATFNNMTSRLRRQRDELISTNTTLDHRMRFTEAVMSGVTAGVIGVNSEGNITLINPSAKELLGVSEEELLDQPLIDAIPSFASLLDKAESADANNRIEDQIDILKGGVERHFAVRITSEKADDEDYGYVVTFDDITELVSAQRNTAWADIARRIAHEIKNPLTPIQLSAERIRRKYGDTLGQDRTVFDQCTDTIVRQVGDIGRMVDEFSSFARMPEPSKKMHDVRAVIRDALILFESSHPKINFELESPDDPLLSLCDERLLSQAVTNLVKNASEAISSAQDKAIENGEEPHQGRILIRVLPKDKQYYIEVIDNGCGLPETNRNKLVEPYMTTREKGTGLGLAIVQKITEQHGGMLQLSDAPKELGFDQGACMRLIIPLSETAAKEQNGASVTDADSAKHVLTKTEITNYNKNKKNTEEQGELTDVI